ncbi:MAG: glycosyltransferase [Planctomycetota bacterium]
MRFTLVSTQKDIGGGEILLRSIGHQLQLDGHSVSWIGRGDSELVKRMDANQRLLYSLRGRGRNVGDIRTVRSRLRNWAPDVLIMNDTHSVMLGGLATLGWKRNRPIRLAYKHTVFPLRSRLKYQLLTDSVVCVSEAARKKILEGGLSQKNTKLIYGGIHPPEPQLDQVARAQFREQLGISAGTLLIVAIGNLLPVKGHAELIEALRRFSEHSAENASNFRLLIAGEGTQRAALEEQISASRLTSQVQLLGFRSDSNRLIEAADLLIHPSHLEGLSLVLIQAQMLQKPIMATAVGGAAEVLNVGQSDCASRWVIDANNPASITAQLQAATEELHRSDRLAERQADLQQVAADARERFSLKTNSTKLVEFAAELSGKRNAA